MPSRRLWHLHVDDRSREIGWTIGSKTYRSRHESGHFGGFLHYDLAVPYNEGRPLPGWRVGLPQVYKGLAWDGRLLCIQPPKDEKFYMEFFVEPLGVPGALLCELFANLEMIPAEELHNAESLKAHATHVSQASHKVGRSSKSERYFRKQENV
jgi:hypothetical protein